MTTSCGYIALIGRPNVGKSTLLNALLGKKVSITSRKPQTTRHQILGIKTLHDTQYIFVDTPGLHQGAKRVLNRVMNRTALQVLKSVDCILWLVDATRWTEDDNFVYEKIQRVDTPVVLALNKIDLLPNHDAIIPLVAELSAKLKDVEIVPVSAKKHLHIDHLEQMLALRLPENPFFFPAQAVTDRPAQFIATEFIREKLIHCLGQELPYATSVGIDYWRKKDKVLHIHATIWVEKEGQKGIVIGRHGEMLKKIGQRARLAIEDYLDAKIFLQLWVKVKSSWSEDERLVKQLLS